MPCKRWPVPTLALILVLPISGCASSEAPARTLDAREVYDVSAIDAVRRAGYSLSSAICEVESPRAYEAGNRVFGGRLFFHAFRATRGGNEQVLLFASNHPVAGGGGLVIPVNTEASALDRDLPKGAAFREPILEITSGADIALRCARDAGPSPLLTIAGLDLDAWRRTTAKQFGSEQTHSDGSKDDYIRLALSLCKEDQSKLKTRLGRVYEGSLQEHIAGTFCPYL